MFGRMGNLKNGQFNGVLEDFSDRGDFVEFAG
jgi:hypothetical protein